MVMDYRLILLALVYSFSGSFANNKSSVCVDTEGFYWRDYVGVIPKDAFPGGLDVNGSTSYVGQVLHNNLLIPGEIVASEQRIYYEWGFTEYIATEYVKILCTQHPEEFYWVIATTKNFKTLTDKHFVSAGFEPENRIFIGRTSDGARRLGKVQLRLSDQTPVFHFTENGTGVFRESFEILALAGAH